MSATLYLLLVSLILAQYFIVKKVFSSKGMEQCLIMLNSALWFYGVLFLWIMSMSSGELIGFVGGLGDIIYFLILCATLLLHPIAMLILLYMAPKKTYLLWIPLILFGLSLLMLHLKATERAQSYDLQESESNTSNILQSDSLKAEQGDMYAQYAIALNYYQGNGVEQNDSLALKWFRLSAEQGHNMARWFMATAYYNGTVGLEQNYAEAVKWYRLMAKNDYEEGEYNLGICYLDGKGVVQNNDTAFYWLKLAAQKGYKEAQQLLEECGQEWETKKAPDSVFHLPPSLSMIDIE